MRSLQPRSLLSMKLPISVRLSGGCERSCGRMGYDKRIGSAMLDAVLVGRFVLPKDVKALPLCRRKLVEPRILNTVTHANYDRRRKVVKHIEEMLALYRGKPSLAGMAFNPTG